MTRIIVSAIVIGYLLLAVGANIIEAKDNDLFQAAASGDLRMVMSFLEAGADVNAKYKDGKTALMQACWGVKLEVLKLLLDKGADIHAKDKNGQTALMVAFDLRNKSPDPNITLLAYAKPQSIRTPRYLERNRSVEGFRLYQF